MAACVAEARVVQDGGLLADSYLVRCDGYRRLVRPLVREKQRVTDAEVRVLKPAVSPDAQPTAATVSVSRALLHTAVISVLSACDLAHRSAACGVAAGKRIGDQEVQLSLAN